MTDNVKETGFVRTVDLSGKPESRTPIIMQCLEKDPGNRPGSARELGALLDRCELAESWDEKRAETWWKTHSPDKA